MSDLEAFAREAFVAPPVSAFLGARLTAVGPRSAEIAVERGDRLRQQPGPAHGGVPA